VRSAPSSSPSPPSGRASVRRCCGGSSSEPRGLGLSRLFCLTFETEFFARHGFEVIEGQAVDPEVYAELLRSYDEGVAEFLDLERVKPNTLGNTRMLRKL
jgi:amino-acid N-acetyltransferase